MAFFTAVQDPQEKLDYVFNWQDDTLPEGSTLVVDETIAASTWEAFDADGVTPNVDIALDDPAASFTDTTTTVWISDLVLGRTFIVTNHITTDQGRKYDRSIRLKCRLK